ncbi:polyprenyl synthetase family protein [Arthrobacter sp. zg-Y820]|uniref:polyprenyl synthetase family protein n=1 Tax=unclassified Arthrobacter TaxID=235627 RepID=UPI001E6161AB|nr:MULTISPECIES: polyprenyl synthetase family protein [unclassified Arthrobacter]MCC9195711.1 polyprenyl synthetase family protein [Arthrobacter sp. zg-Y820]MDK1278570.1 polyprenyl synthetase family protein [Arthrobacter sp. zg.Y820]WIB08996.1 polyprenyl synthetase family protein [Arthrobacter sp. zg-Y820]
METNPLLDPATGHEQVEGVLKGFFERAKLRAAKVSPSYLSLWETLEQSTAGGKRVRPGILMTAYRHLGGTDIGAAARVGAAFELLHTALIIHDDVIDLDFVRRGHDNVSGVYRSLAETAGQTREAARHRGMSTGIIAGDLALTGAFRMLDTVDTDPRTRLRLAEILDEAVFASAAGELIDVDFSFSPGAPPVREILDMERLKTAVYSFEAPLQAGAVLAGADDDVVAILGDFGRDTGIAYQLVDDLLGVFGKESATGKSNLSDLREGKRTVLISHASQGPCWGELSHLIGNPDLTPEDADRARAVLTRCGARDYAQSLAEEFAARARTHLDSPAIPAPLRLVLERIVAGAVNRGR